jgi:RNA polymerase sigma-70 factor, ECF subfamily
VNAAEWTRHEVAVDQRELVERAGQGDHEAFAALVAASIPRLEAIARLILQDPELARDAVQEGYLRAWRDLRGLREPDRFDAWLYRLIIHACRDVARLRRRLAIEVDMGPVGPATHGDISDLVADHDQLERGFRRLGTDQRAVLVLHYYIGMPMPAVAETLGIPLGTAQSRLGRALTTLRRDLGPQRDAKGAIVRKGQIA